MNLFVFKFSPLSENYSFRERVKEGERESEGEREWGREIAFQRVEWRRDEKWWKVKNFWNRTESVSIKNLIEFHHCCVCSNWSQWNKSILRLKDERQRERESEREGENESETPNLHLGPNLVFSFSSSFNYRPQSIPIVVHSIHFILNPFLTRSFRFLHFSLLPSLLEHSSCKATKSIKEEDRERDGWQKRERERKEENDHRN